MRNSTTSNVKAPRVTLVLLVALIIIGAGNFVLFALTQQPMQLVLGVILMAAGAVNIVRLKRAV